MCERGHGVSRLEMQFAVYMQPMSLCKQIPQKLAVVVWWPRLMVVVGGGCCGYWWSSKGDGGDACCLID